MSSSSGIERYIQIKTGKAVIRLGLFYDRVEEIVCL